MWLYIVGVEWLDFDWMVVGYVFVLGFGVGWFCMCEGCLIVLL